VGIKFASPLPLGSCKLAEEIFIDSTECVVIKRCWNLRHFLKQFFRQRTRENVVAFGEYTRQLRIVLFYIPHGFIDCLANVGAFRQCEKMVEARVRG
jgi:hypothetical protein